MTSIQPQFSDDQLLRELIPEGGSSAEELLPLLYEELHELARLKMSGQRPDHTLQATALVNEAFLKIFRNGTSEVRLRDRDHLMALASRAMRSVLIDYARAKNCEKRLPVGECIPLEELTASYEEQAVDLIALDDALSRLAVVDETMVRIVEMRFFGGLETKDVARILGLSLRKVEREWRAARAWLKGEVQ